MNKKPKKLKKTMSLSKPVSPRKKPTHLLSAIELQQLESELQVKQERIVELRSLANRKLAEEQIEKRRSKIHRLADDRFPQFSKLVLGYDDSDHQLEWELILEDEDYKWIGVAAPRNHSKTTVFSVKFPLWKIKKNPNVRIVLVSNAQSQAVSFLREITNNIERNQKYIDWAGKLKPDQPEKWTDAEIIVNRDNLRLKDPTISAVGIGGAILSKRADIIICDDILNKENTRTPEQRRKVKEWFDEVLLPILEPGGRVIVAGTLWDPEDLLTAILEDPEWDYKRKYKAIIEDAIRQDLWDQYYEIWKNDRKAGMEFYRENEEEMLRGSKVLWANRFPYRVLWHLRKKNSFAFSRMYQSEHISRTDQPFKEPWIERAKSMGRSLRLVNSMQEWIDNYNALVIRVVMQGMDLQGSDSEEADDSVLLTLAKTAIGKYVIMNIERGKYSPNDTRQTVRQQYARFLPLKVKVESVGIQEWIKRDLAEDGVMDMPIEGYKTGSEKWDDQIGLLSIAVLMENDRLILPYDKTDARTVRLIDLLVDEMRKFPQGHTGDSLMALWFALIGHRDMQITGETTIAPAANDIRKTNIAGDIETDEDGSDQWDESEEE